MCRVCNASEVLQDRFEALPTAAEVGGFVVSDVEESEQPEALMRLLAGYGLTPHEVHVLNDAGHSIAMQTINESVRMRLFTGQMIPPNMAMHGIFVQGLIMGMLLNDELRKNPEPWEDDPSVPDDMKGNGDD